MSDKDGSSDLIVSRDSGVYLFTNKDGKFSGQNLNVTLNKKTAPLSVAVSDINRDGYFDMYISGYIKLKLAEGQNIFNKEGYGGSSVMLLNNGDNSFRDITKESGLYYLHNTFQGVFIDLDNDLLEDLVVAHDTGQVRTWKNMGNLKFKNMPNPNSEQSSYPMGIAVADYNNDGQVDLFFSNVGNTPPGFLVKGDLREDQVFNRKWILFRNDGGFNVYGCCQGSEKSQTLSFPGARFLKISIWMGCRTWWYLKTTLVFHHTKPRFCDYPDGF